MSSLSDLQHSTTNSHIGDESIHFSLLIPDGVGVRNFVYGDLLRLCSEQGAVTVLHALQHRDVEELSHHMPENVKWIPLPPYQESALVSSTRYSLEFAQMYWANTQAMRYRRQLPARGSWQRRVVKRAARVVGWTSATQWRMQRLNDFYCALMRRSQEYEHYRELFSRTRTSILFCSNQRSPSNLAAALAARDLQIPVAAFVFSWDNLTSKGRIAAPYDYYLVWSAHMQQELMRYYPYVSDESVLIVGAPQFDPYGNRQLLWPRETFFRTIGADPTRPLICYSGGDVETCPEEPDHVRILMQLIREGHITGKPQVMLRPAPVDEGHRFRQVRQDFPELIYAAPAWKHPAVGAWHTVVPQSDDIQMLANVTAHVDLNVNVASTMTLDFACHDRPIVNIAFNAAEPPAFGIPLWEFYYQFDHYRPVVEMGAARCARSSDQLAQFVNMYLQDPSIDRAARRQLVELEVGQPLGSSSQNIVDALCRFAKGERATPDRVSSLASCV